MTVKIKKSIQKMKTYLPLPLQCDWPSSPAAEQPGLHRPEAGESVWPVAPVEHQSLDTRCWSTHTTKNALEDCLARQGNKLTNGSFVLYQNKTLKILLWEPDQRISRILLAVTGLLLLH